MFYVTVTSTKLVYRSYNYIEQMVDPKIAECLLCLYERPMEPTFILKGERNIFFDVPEKWLPERYRPIIKGVINRFEDELNERISIKDVLLPDLSLPLSLSRRDSFSIFIPHHRKIAARLIDILIGMTTPEDFLAISVYCRDSMNPFLFIYAFSVAILHRPDTRTLRIPPLFEVFPEKFCDSSIFARVKEESNIFSVGSRIPLEIPQDYTASDLDEEHRVAYFREDIGINLHHWHWHLVYPFDAAKNIVDKDRRGELFYYMHQQIVARYNFERFSNNLARVKRFIDWHEPIKEGYFPKLDSLVSSRVWPSRIAHTKIHNVYRDSEKLKFDIQDLERWRDRFFDAIHAGSVVSLNGEKQELTETQGIDLLGNMMEASILSVNPNIYGDLHNLGHLAIAYAHDPDNRHLETFGVMGDSSTAMRDPIFYRWHAFIDDIFQEHKNILPRYTADQLDFPGITIKSVNVNGETINVLRTYWQQSDVDLSRGLDFSPRGSVLARFTHLQHSPFSYKIEVENNGSFRQGTVRIFLAPKSDERGVPFPYTDQKNFFIELDKFVVNLKPEVNTIERKSEDSSVTIPFEQTFRNLEAGRPTGGNALEKFNFCGCGWPQHMLIPKGSPGGLECQLFVMISNYEDDMVKQLKTSNNTCDDAASYCGIRDQMYPDKRSMGFPFDRQPRDGVSTLHDFLTPNMKVQDVIIKFSPEKK